MEAVPVTSDTQKPSSWVKWIRKIYETNHLTCCSKCGNQCGSLPFSNDPLEISRILEHIGKQSSRAPALMPTNSVPSFCDFGDMNFQYNEFTWYPYSPALDF